MQERAGVFLLGVATAMAALFLWQAKWISSNKDGLEQRRAPLYEAGL